MVCAASNVFWWPIRIHCTQRVKKKRTWKIVRKETPFPKNPFRVYVQFPELVPFEFSKRHSPSTIIILNATSHTLFAARKTQDTFQRVIFVCVLFLPKKGFLLKELRGGRSHCHFAVFFQDAGPLRAGRDAGASAGVAGALYIWGLRWMLKGLQVREGSGWSFFSMSFNGMFLMKLSFGFKTWLKWLRLTNIWGGNADFLKMPSFWLSFHPMCLSMNSRSAYIDLFLLPPQNHNFFLPRFSSSIILSCF